MIPEGQEIARLLIGSSSDGILAFDTECRYTLWNPMMERITGLRAEQVVGRIAFDVFPFLAEIGEDQHFRDALAGRTTRTAEREFTIPETGRRGYFEGSYSPLHASDGRVIGGLAIIRDITERKLDTAARFAFLARAGETLASSLDYAVTLQQLAELALPILGDVCIVDMVEGAQLRRVAVAHVKPEKLPLLDELRRLYPASRGSRAPAAQVMVTGRPHIALDVTPPVVLELTNESAHADLIRRIGFRSHIAVPLIARGSVIGVISLGITESSRRYTDEDLSLATDLARRAALAIDQALLYQAVSLSESRFRATTEQSPLSIQVFNADGTVAMVNKAWERFWGLTLADIPNFNVLNDPQLEASGMAPLLRRAFAGEVIELPVHRYDPNIPAGGASRNADAVRYLRTFAYPIKSTSGEVLEVALIQEDVTDRMRAEERLRTSEERLRVAMLGAQMSVWEWDIASDRIETVDETQSFWGIRSGALQDFLRVLHPDDHAAIYAARARAADDGQPYVSEYRTIRDGRTRWAYSRGVSSERADGSRRIIGVTVDITERKLAAEATSILADAGASLGASLDLHQTLDNFVRSVVPRLADWCAVDLLDDAGELRRVAAYHRDPALVASAIELFTKYPPRKDSRHGKWEVIRSGMPELTTVIDDSWLVAMAHDDDHLALLRKLGAKSSITVPLIVRGTTLGVMTLAASVSGRVFGDADVALATDLARRTASAIENARLYQRLREEDRRKDEFIATLAHELRNPLAPLSSGIELMQMIGDTKLEPARRIMERQMRHLVQFVDDLLDVSRVTRGKVALRKEEVDVAALVATALEASRPLFERGQVELTVSLPDGPLTFLGDRTRVAQVLTNLLNNAAKYTEPGGKARLDVTRDGDVVVFELADTGIGIPREMQSQIFEMFVQVQRSYEQRQGGLGIGLTLVRRLVELHGGRVWAESQGAGRGSKFTVRLPGGIDAAVEQSHVPVRAPRTRKRVLLVDDNADAVYTLAAVLELDGHEVRTAGSAPDALAIVHQFQPDVALLDIGLPGMNGYELARRMRKDPQLAHVLLVAVTGWGQEEDRRLSQEAGFDRHFTKPVDPRELHALFES